MYSSLQDKLLRLKILGGTKTKPGLYHLNKDTLKSEYVAIYVLLLYLMGNVLEGGDHRVKHPPEKEHQQG